MVSFKRIATSLIAIMHLIRGSILLKIDVNLNQ